MRALVADISKYDPDFNPVAFREMGGAAVIVKATMGFGRDALLDRHASLTIGSGLALELYHWLDPTSTLQRQVDLLRAAIRQYHPAAVWVDVEQWWGDWDLWYAARAGRISMSRVPVVSDRHQFDLAARFIAAIQADFDPERVGIYTGKWFIDRYCPSLRGIVGAHPLWLAQYVSGMAGEFDGERLQLAREILQSGRPALPVNARTWDLWQVSDRVKLTGVCSNAVDLNVSRLEEGEYLAWLGGEPVADPKPGVREVVVTAWLGLRVREQPSTAARKLKTLGYAARVRVEDAPGEWLKLADEPGWISAVWVR